MIGKLGKLRRWNRVTPLWLVLLLPVIVTCQVPEPPAAELDLAIPAAGDWTDYGVVLASGGLEDWDTYLWGGFAASAVKKDDTYFLYYQGADDYDTVFGTVTWRAIGVATSPDGINFTKYSGNPVLTWFPNNYLEEGAVSSAAIYHNSQIYLYYGANTEQSIGTGYINADARLAVSADGVNFTDLGIVLDHRDAGVWGAGDELFPVAAFTHNGQWFVYYIPNGTNQRAKLGVAWGNNPQELPNSGPAVHNLQQIDAWGTSGAAQVGPNVYALLINNVQPAVAYSEVRIANTGSPNSLSGPAATYTADGFGNYKQATFLLDEAANTWFMYYRNEDSSAYGVKLAPVGEPDTSPPTAPSQVRGTATCHPSILLNWDPASDPDTGIVQYRIYRDDNVIATVKGWSFTDPAVTSGSSYAYSVSAINYHGTEGPGSPEIVVTADKDECINFPLINGQN
jgi:hypothetical protein